MTLKRGEGIEGNHLGREYLGILAAFLTVVPIAEFAGSLGVTGPASVLGLEEEADQRVAREHTFRLQIPLILTLFGRRQYHHDQQGMESEC